MNKVYLLNIINWMDGIYLVNIVYLVNRVSILGGYSTNLE